MKASEVTFKLILVCEGDEGELASYGELTLEDLELENIPKIYGAVKTSLFFRTAFKHFHKVAAKTIDEWEEWL